MLFRSGRAIGAALPRSSSIMEDYPFFERHRRMGCCPSTGETRPGPRRLRVVVSGVYTLQPVQRLSSVDPARTERSAGQETQWAGLLSQRNPALGSKVNTVGFAQKGRRIAAPPASITVAIGLDFSTAWVSKSFARSRPAARMTGLEPATSGSTGQQFIHRK